MTVAELIEILKRMPQHAKVFAPDAEYHREIVEVPRLGGVYLDGENVMIDPAVTVARLEAAKKAPIRE
jgi:hypothetical protein